MVCEQRGSNHRSEGNRTGPVCGATIFQFGGCFFAGSKWGQKSFEGTTLSHIALDFFDTAQNRFEGTTIFLFALEKQETTSGQINLIKLMAFITFDIFATGVINEPVEFAIFAYVDTWAGLGGWGGDDDVSCTCTHVTCYGLDVSCTCTHVTCYASHGEGWVGGVGMMTFLSLAHM